MDVEISVAGGLIERHKWGKNTKIYTRRFRKDKLENVTFDWPVGTVGKNDDDGKRNYREGFSDEMDIDMVSDRSIHTLAAQDSSVQDKDNDIVVDQSLLRIEAVKELNPVQEKDKDILLDQALQIVASDNQSLQSTATEDLISVQEDGNDTMHDQSLKITATEDLNLVQWYENDTMHDQYFQITTAEELNSAQKDENDTMHDQNLTSVQEDIDTVHDQSLQISAEKKLNLVQEDRDDTVNNQSLEVIANKDLKSVEEDRNGLVHDQSLQVIANKDLKPVEEDRNDIVHDQSLELMAIKDLKSVQDDRNDTVHDRSLEVISNEDLNSVEEDRNDTVHHLSLEAMAIEDLESVEEDRTDTAEDQSLEAIANEDLKSVEDVINNTVHHQSLEVIANKDLKSVEEDGNDAEHHQYLETITKEDLKSIEGGIKDTTHDQSLETMGIEDIKSVQKEDSDSVHKYSVPLDTEDLNSPQEAGNDSGNDQFSQTVALEDPSAVQDDKDGTTQDQPPEIIASEDLDSVQKDFNDTLHDPSLQMTATEHLSLAQDDKDDAAHDHSLQAVTLKDLASVRKEDNDKLHESSVSIATDDMNSAQEDDNNTMHEESLQTIANEGLNSVQEDKSDTLHHQSLQIITNEDLNSRQKEGNDTVHESSVTVATEDMDLIQEDIDDTVHIQPLKVVTEDLNLLQGRESVSLLHLGNDDLVSDHDPHLQGTVENGCAPRRNDYALDKTMIIKADGKVTISLAPARSKNKIRGLKRILEYEVDQVRSVVQRLDAKKIQLTSSSAGNGIYGVNRSHMHTQVEEVRGLEKVNSVVGSVGYYDSRPFQHLNVCEWNNYHDVYEFGEKEKRNPKQNRYYRSSEFLLAKDRLPPADSNKKLKCNGLRKHGGETGYGFVRNKYTAKALKSCTNLLARLMRHKFGWVFNKPVDAEALRIHDYHYIIRNPMDLGTIKSRLAKNLYKFPAEFAEDVRLTLRNAMTYNPRGHEVHIMAEQMSNIFEDKWVAIESDYNYNWRYGLGHDMASPTPLLRKVLPPPSLERPPALDMRVLEKAESMTMPTDCRLEPNTPVGRTPVPKKPKAKDPHKRDMTYDEKQRLSIHLQNLPSDKMNAIIQIIKRSNSSLSQRDDEIELDIDTLNAETLWDLDRLVTNYKKNLSKKKRRAELALQAKAEARPAVLPTDHAPAITQAPEASKKDQNNAHAFPLPGEKPRDVRSFPLPGEKLRESSSSSSSSSDSDSDSDSSDSDSDSSSGNG